MAVDNGIVVAISTVATAIIAGSITLLSKLIDAFQKRNEQSMTITITYINKKIEAGQRFVNRTNILTHNRNLIRQYLVSLKMHVHNIEHFTEKVRLGEEKLSDATFSGESYLDVYFDLNDFEQKGYTIIDKLNVLMPLIEPNSPTCQENNYFENVDEAIRLIDELLAVYQNMNKKVREDLQKYDII